MRNERASDELNRRNTAFDNRLRPGQFGEFVDEFFGGGRFLWL